MRKIFEIALLMLVATNGYSQLSHKTTEDFQILCDSNKIIFVDSLGKEISSNYAKLVYNGIDVLYLDHLNDVEFKNLIGAFPGQSNPTDSNRKYCIMCSEEVTKIVDSIDINNNGVKELFLLRQWYCSSTPANLDPYGVVVGGQQLVYSKYEVWDVKSKKKIFEIKNMLDNQMSVSTSVVISRGYKLDVSINKSGSIILSNLSGDIFGNMPELGTYKYDNETNGYKKE
jgi:hypothetical protein